MVSYNGIRALFLGAVGVPVAKAAMETRIENLERKMDEVERFLKGKHQTQARRRSPLQREHHRMEERGRCQWKERRSRVLPLTTFRASQIHFITGNVANVTNPILTIGRSNIRHLP